MECRPQGWKGAWTGCARAGARPRAEKLGKSRGLGSLESNLSPRFRPGRASLQVVRERCDDRSLAEQEPPLEEQRRLVVEDVAPPVPHDELGQQHRDDVVLPSRVELVDVPQDRTGELAV